MKAFPSKIIDFQESQFQGRTVYQDENEGMDLRDYFAAKAMQGFLSGQETSRTGRKTALARAEFAYQLADAMMKQREL